MVKWQYIFMLLAALGTGMYIILGIFNKSPTVLGPNYTIDTSRSSTLEMSIEECYDLVKKQGDPDSHDDHDISLFAKCMNEKATNDNSYTFEYTRPNASTHLNYVSAFTEKAKNSTHQNGNSTNPKKEPDTNGVQREQHGGVVNIHDLNVTKVFVEARRSLSTIPESKLQTVEYISVDIHLRSWSFPINVKDCDASTENFIILVPTAPKNSDSRTIIRSTWGKPELIAKIKSRLIFLVGLDRNTEVQRKLEEEASTYQDIVQLDMYDSYYNLTLKTLGMLEWASEHCKTPQFLAKIDDDNLVNLDNILSFAQSSARKYRSFIGGSYRQNGSAGKGGKWADPIYPVVYGKTKYPVFLGGPGYVMTNSIAGDLVKECSRLPFIHLEDVFVTGICAEQMKVKKLDMKGMTMQHKDACYLSKTPGVTLSHNYPRNEMISTWNKWHSDKPCRSAASL